MIYGIGTDLVKKERIAQMFARYQDRFAHRILANEELSIFETHKQPIAYLAKRFAAKEAIVKALGTGFIEGVYFTNIAILSNPLGKPTISFSGKTKMYIEQIGQLKCEVSISDDAEYALAFAIVTKI